MPAAISGTHHTPRSQAHGGSQEFIPMCCSYQPLLPGGTLCEWLVFGLSQSVVKTL